jgi:uncharacterized membrane-anchored protein YitT (DUF2179 family)
MSSIRREATNALLMAGGILSAAMGLKGFLFSSHFIDGGVTGISMLLWKITSVPLSIWLVAVNLPFVLLGYRQLGRAFAVRSALAIVGLAIVVATVHFPDVTPDALLTAVFGGVFIGAGIGLAMRGGAVLDGTEIAALLIGRRSAMLKVGDVILGFNVVLFLAAMTVLGVEPALYSILTYVSAARTLEFILHGIEEFTAITVMSAAPEPIRQAILGQMGRGVTIYRARGGKSGEDREILYCVVTRLEIGRVMRIIETFDAAAFVVQHPLADVRGGVVHRHALP